ncbi:MAG: DMT family transporter [Candidatus Binatia bacterium]
MAVTAATAAVADRAPVARAYLGLTVATACWASAFILGKVVLREMTPLVLATWRYVVASLVLLPFVLRSRAAVRPGTVPATGAVLPLAVMVVSGGVLYPWLFLAALARTSAANTSLLIALNPIVTLLLSPLVGERLVRTQVLGASLAFAGAVLVISRGDLVELLALRIDTGDLLALAAAACWATFNLTSRLVVDRLPASSVNLAVYAGGAVALGLLGLADGPVVQLEHATASAVGAVVAMAVLSSVVAGQLFLTGVRDAGVGRAVVFIYLVPVLTAIMSVAVLGEQLSGAQLAGGAAVLAGLLLTTRSGSR